MKSASLYGLNEQPEDRDVLSSHWSYKGCLIYRVRIGDGIDRADLEWLAQVRLQPKLGLRAQRLWGTTGSTIAGTHARGDHPPPLLSRRFLTQL
jgi:hypothetical protein